MKIINLAAVSRKKSNEESNNTIIPPNSESVLRKINFNSIVMSGTAKRKAFEQKENHYGLKNIKKNERTFKESLMKLRTPFYKYKQKCSQEVKVMTKSCEILFECIKPYKNICVTEKTKVKKSPRNTGNFLETTNIIYEWKATRKVQFISFPEEKSMPNFFLKQNALLPATDSSDFGSGNLTAGNEPKVFIEAKGRIDQAGKTVSSSDFITSVLSEPETTFSELIKIDPENPIIQQNPKQIH